VKIEFGARSDHWPADEQIIIPYVEETFPQLAPTSPTPIRIIDPVRTFWEKATILHQWAHAPEGKNLPPRYSRHYTDLASLIDAGIGDQAKAANDIREAVIHHKLAFYYAAWANYPNAKPGTLRILPPAHLHSAIVKDHQAMTEMFFGTPPDIGECLAILEAWEFSFNQI